MMEDAVICLERDTANDESATIVAVHVLTGSEVGEDELIFEIENSKATQELRAPQAGVLIHALSVGAVVPFGEPLARVVSEGTSPHNVSKFGGPPEAPGLQGPPGERPVMDGAPRRGTESHFSRAAVALLEEHGLSRDAFTSSFVTSKDVAERLGLHVPCGPPPAPKGEALPLMSRPTIGGGPKRFEIEALRSGAGATWLSVLGLTLGPLSVTRPAGDILTGRITDLVIYEASRLMRKYPLLNAAFESDHTLRHEAVHAGLALDGGGRLIVYGIRNADRLGLSDIGTAIIDGAARYASNDLKASELTCATFTVTDLSAEDLDFIFPLLPAGQSCIIGIVHSASGYRLFAGFDHRVTEGREVSLFLNELRDRLYTFGSRPDAGMPTTACSICGRSALDAMQKGRDKGLLKLSDHHGRELLCCASCWNGW